MNSEQHANVFETKKIFEFQSNMNLNLFLRDDNVMAPHSDNIAKIVLLFDTNQNLTFCQFQEKSEFNLRY